jgi:uncharacterized protein (TIGR03437 family)
LCLTAAGQLAAQTPVVAEGGVLNAASAARGQAVAPGSLISIFGSELASGLSQADSIPLATTLGGVSVTVNNVAAPLLFVSGGQINAQFPFNAMPDPNASGTAQLVVRRGSASATSTVQVAPFSPGIFSVQFGVGQAIAVNADGSLAAPAGSIPGLATQPARAGGVIIIYCTGLGPVDPPLPSGTAPVFQPNPQLHSTTTPPTVLVGNSEARVLFSGLSPQFAGVYQLNVEIPAGAPTGNTVPLRLRQGGITTTDQVTIAIQ